MHRSTNLLLLSLFANCGILTAQDSSLEKPLATVNAIGNAGEGHQVATSAWKLIGRADPSSLPTVLKAIDDAKPLSANWIRAAVDQIAERAVQDGRKLPKAELEKIAFDSSYSPRARRLAYEWLVRVDKDATDRIIPKMLNDSSVEMRRDAVAFALGKAELAASKEEAKKQYRVALSSARDTDQIDKAFEKLSEMGEQVDLPRHFGFITTWKLIGPFDNRDKRGFNVAYAPEQEIDLAKSYVGKTSEVSWIDYQTKDKYGMVNLNEAVGKNMGAAAYALATFESDKVQEVDLRLGCICAAKVWLNGQLKLERDVYHAGTKIDQYTTRGKLKAGSNTILLKICQNEQTENWAQDWQFQFRICDRVGTAILSKNRR